MGKERTPDSLAGRLTWSLAALVIAASAVGGAWSWWRAGAQAQTEVQAKIHSSTTYLSGALALPLWNVDDEAVRRIGQTLIEDDAFHAVTIRDTAGRVIFTARRPASETAEATVISVTHDGAPIGLVNVEFSGADLRRQTRQVLTGIVETFGAVLLVTSFGAAVLVRRLLERPIAALTDAALRYGSPARGTASEPTGFAEFQPLLRVLSDLESRINRQVEQLQASEERFRSIFNSVTDAIFIHAPSGAVLDVNERMCVMYGCTRDEATALTIGDISSGTPPYSQEDAVGWLAKAAAGQQPVFDWLARRKTGELFWVEVSMRQAAIGGERRILVAVRDIGERKQTEATLRASEVRYRTLFEAADDAIFMMENGRFIQCNPKTLTMFECREEDILGKTPVDFSPPTQPDGRPSGEGASEKIRAALTGVCERFEWRHRTLDGAEFDAEVSLSRIDPGGGPFVQAIVRDITERKRAEHGLARRAEFDELMTGILSRFVKCHSSELEAAVDAALQGFAGFLGADHAFVIRFDGSTWAVTHEWCAAHVPPIAPLLRRVPLGSLPWSERRLLAGEIIRVNTPDDYPPEAAAERAGPDARAGRQSILVVPIRGSDGFLRDAVVVDSHARPITWTDEDVSRLRIVGDVTATVIRRAEAEEEARRHLQSLVQADKMASLGIMVSGVAHEINNPNNLIMLSADVMKSLWPELRAGIDPDAVRRPPVRAAGIPFSEATAQIGTLIENIAGGAVRIQRIVQNLKDFARADSGELQSGVDLRQIVDAAVSLLNNLIRKSTDHFSVVHGELPTVAGNAQKLEQVLINLIANACQALPDRARAVAVRTQHLVDRGLVAIEVRDAGTGIPRDHLAKIFDPFFTTKRDTGGTGLGLSVSYGIVKEHGGEIAFESEVGVGTTATILLPVGRARGQEVIR